MISCRLSADTVTLGGTLRGRIDARHEGDRAPRALVIEVGWRTEGRGSVDAHAVFTVRLPPPDGEGGWSEPFEAAIPPTGPVSYDGKLLRILWEVRAHLDIPWASDEKAAWPFRVAIGP